MDGQVRDDLHADLPCCQRQSDLVLALGSSLCGMAADQLVGIVADRARRNQALGVVIVSLQQTVRDEESALRIFARWTRSTSYSRRSSNWQSPARNVHTLLAYQLSIGAV